MSRFKTIPAPLTLVSPELSCAALRIFETVKSRARQQALRLIAERLRQP